MARKNKRQTSSASLSFARTPPQKFEFNPDYSMVRKDLKRIGALAGFFIAVLVILSFFLK